MAGRAGTSLKHEHLQAIVADEKRDLFFEVHAENYMGADGPPHTALNRIRHDYPVSLHGVCMSIGGPQPLVLDSSLWRKPMTLERQTRNGWQAISQLVQRVNAMISLIAHPSLTHIVLR